MILRPRFLRWLSLRLAAAFCFLAASFAVPSAAIRPCCAEEAEDLFADDFSALDPSLGDESDSLGVSDNVLFYKQKAGYYWRTFYDALLFDDADATIRMRLDFGAETDAVVGLAFWGVDLDEYYVVMISDAGTYSVSHASPGGWHSPVPWRSTDAIKVDPEAWNEVRVVTSGRRATIFINGREVVRVKGRPPAGGSLFGLYCQGGKADLVAEFSELRILQGPPPPEGDLASDPNVLLSDDFSTLDPAWGSQQGWFDVRDGHLAIDFDARQSFNPLYSGDAFPDVDATIKARIGGDSVDPDAAAGLIFWAEETEDDENYYLLQVYGSGQVGIARRVNGEWRYPLRAREMPPEAKNDAKGWTELRIVTEGKRATAYVNGVKLATIPGQPPKGAWKIGVFGQSGDAASQSQFSDLVVRKP